jgi:hypothetical protein
MPPRCSELSMLRPSKTGILRVRAPDTAAGRRDADIYRSYAVGMYRQALASSVRAVLRRLTTSPPAAVEDDDPNGVHLG